MSTSNTSQSNERAERKRRLGVLAQRRYRQRKKDELRRLQDKVTSEGAIEPLAQPSSLALPTSYVPSLEETASSASAAETSGNTNTALPCNWAWNDPCLSIDESIFLGQQLLDLNPDILQPPTPAESAFSRLSDMAVSQYQFPDDRVFQIPELDLMATASVFAKMLNCEETMWSFTASRTLDISPGNAELLPLNFRPTEAQRRIMHHPIFDLLPWASVRTKLICTFAQKADARPPIARDEMALMRFVNDLDDSAEGLRVCGEDRSDCNNWEIGQQILNNWWWAFDVSIILNSNKLRARRGAPRLMLEAP